MLPRTTHNSTPSVRGMTSGTLAQTNHDLRSTSCAASLRTLKASDGTGKNWCTGRGPRFGSWSCQNALPAWVGIPAKLVTPEMNAHDVHDASEIVGENVQRISVATFGRRFIRKCVVPILIFSVAKGCSTASRREVPRERPLCVSADRQQRLNSSTRCRCRTMRMWKYARCPCCRSPSRRFPHLINADKVFGTYGCHLTPQGSCQKKKPRCGARLAHKVEETCRQRAKTEWRRCALSSDRICHHATSNFGINKFVLSEN